MHIDLVDLREISRRSGNPPNQVSSWLRPCAYPFPDPVASLSIGDVWVWGPVRQWLRHEGHPTDADLAHTH